MRSIESREAPRWFSTSGTQHRAPRVLRHRDEDHDLSVLKMEENLGKSQEFDVVSELQGQSAGTRVFQHVAGEGATQRWRSDLAAAAASAKDPHHLSHTPEPEK